MEKDKVTVALMLANKELQAKNLKDEIRRHEEINKLKEDQLKDRSNVGPISSNNLSSEDLKQLVQAI